MTDSTPHNTEPAPATARRRPSRLLRPLGVTALALGFVLLVGALSRLLASGGQTTVAMTVEIALAVVAVALMAQGADGLRPRRTGRRHALR